MKASYQKVLQLFLLVMGSCVLFLLLFTGSVMGRPCWLNSDGLRGQVKILKERQYSQSSPWALVATWYYDRMGKETQVWSGGEREGVPISSITATNIFNDQGQVTRQISKWNNGSPAGEVLYAYDDQGNQNVEVGYDNKGSFVRLDFRKFDEQGNCIKDYEYRPSGQWTLSVQRAEYRYNNLGKKTEVMFLRQDGTKQINRYDESGLFKKSLSYAADDQLEQETEFGYDHYGNDIESRTLDSSGILISHTKDTYEYDDKKNWVKRISKWVMKEGKPFDEINITDRTITYYELQDPTLQN